MRQIKEKAPETTTESEPVEIVDPVPLEGPKKRGRKPGSTNKKKTEGVQVESLSRTIMLAHNIPATILKQPIWQIDKTESDLLANAIVDVLTAFDLPVDPKTEALISMFGACAIVYGPRIVQLQQQKSERKRRAIAES
jgi:hypothetical protein